MTVFKYFLRTVLLLSIIEGSTKAGPQKSTCIFRDHQIICEKHLPSLEYPVNTTNLEIRNIDWLELNFQDLVEKFPFVQNVTVIHGRNVTKLVPPPAENNIQVLTLNNLRLKRIRKEFFINFTKLEELSLRFNHLKHLPKQIQLPTVKTILLSGNKWNCSLNLDWVLELNETIVRDLRNLTCHEEPYPGKSLIEIAKFIREIEDECPLKCSCSMPKVVIEPETEVLEPIISVDCSYKGFSVFPETLPSKTKTLYLQGNEISSISPLRTNPLYENILDIFLDYNKISSVEELEGSLWLTQFRVLSLRGNRLSQIPSYAIDNALRQNSNMPNAVRLRLGGNPWRCDCPFTPVFQEMLQKFSHQISDLMEIKCSYVEGDENSMVPIIGLSRSSLCRFPSEYSVQALDLINVILVFLIIGVLAKLAYDYYHFKRTGRVPWIVTKMP
ncbi:protein singed wings 2 isoform X2 [Harmonia axyridis]|uniref:protein singed wings 2 isoform X2 n=1 Tax=Harmonia axyridis TaxID=115357 RepID=UPI001E2753F1|nr:protein singed wings 2 isoform X2 [Harmonia axyridis]